MAKHFQVLIFGDQTFDYAAGLGDLLLRDDCPHLSIFIERATATLRHDISLLPAAQRRILPSFSDLPELLTHAKKRKGDVVLNGVLICVYQLAVCISHYAVDGWAATDTRQTYAVGFCIGSLAAAAMSSAQSVSALLDLGIEAIRIAMRTGLQACQAASSIYSERTRQLDEPENWASVIPHACLSPLDATDTIKTFVHKNAVSQASAPYVSTYAQHSFTLSGAPNVIQSFVESSVASPMKAAKLPIYAPYHAPHVYSEDVIQTTLNDLRVTRSSEYTSARVISASDGKISGQKTFGEHLADAVRDILLRPLDIQAVAGTIAQIMDETGREPTSVIPVGANPGMVGGILASYDPTLRNRYIVTDPLVKGHDLSGDCHRNKSPRKSKIAVIGMSGRFPGAASTEEFWDLLYRGLDVHRPVPKDRFDVKAHFDATGKRKNTSQVTNGCWIDEPGLFDPKFFNISTKEAQQSDPGQRLALQTAYEAMERAGMVPDRTPSTRRDRIGVFYGMTSDDWREVNSGQDVDTYFIPGGNRAFTPGRLNYFFKFSGPSVSIDTACSSSLAAIHMACNSLWTRDCDTAFAGGTNVMTNPDNFAGLDRGYFLSRTGNCKTFDDDADGYCRADGVGTVILKRLEDAEADNDPILGVILGAYTNHSAEAVSITRPHTGAQEYIFSKLLNASGTNPKKISYIEMHGTGTQAGDSIEMASVLNTFAPDHRRLPKQSLYLGSAKANVGHGESASGITALIKVLLMMEYNIIPPHCGIKGRINHGFPKDLAQRNVHIARQPAEWLRPENGEGKRQAFVNNFSAAGGNSAVLLEDGSVTHFLDQSHLLKPDVRPAHVITVSAKSSSALKRNIKNLASFVVAESTRPDLLPQLSYTTTARRMHHPFRFATVAADHFQLQSLLGAISEESEFARTSATPPSVAFVFSGQGAQYMGMGKSLFEYNCLFKTEILRYDQFCISYGYGSIMSVILGDQESASPSPMTTQLATICLQMALVSLWESLGITPNVVVGHSLGHYAALKAAGVLSATDVIHLVGARAQLLQQMCREGSHSMLAVRATQEQIQPLLHPSQHEIACLNGPKEVVISGQVDHIVALSEKLAAYNIKATHLSIPYAFHSSQVDPILDDFEKIVAGVSMQPPHTAVISSLLAETTRVGEEHPFGPEYLRRHCREPVLFSRAIENARSEGLIRRDTVWVEFGPHVQCLSFLKSTLGSETTTVPSLQRGENDWKVLAGSLCLLYQRGLTIDWNEFHRDFPTSHRVLRLPTYSWDNKNYWIQYVNDWTLTKGDAPTVSATPTTSSATSSLLTASVQDILQETVDGSTVNILAQSDFGNAELSQIAHGHKVNGVKICTSSLYADVGLTMGQYLLKQYRTDLAGYIVNVHDLRVEKTLILPEHGQGLFRITISHDTREPFATMSIFSVDSYGSRTLDHASCVLLFEDPKTWSLEWAKTQYLIQRSIDCLEKRSEDGLDSRLAKPMIYRIFSALVEYDPGFMGLQSVIFHGEDYEATARVKLCPVGRGKFVRNPMWIDSFGQLAGFLMNAHPLTSADQVFINHGWKSMRCLRDFRENGEYQSYVRMRCIEGRTFAGDVYILEDGDIIAVYVGITFQGIPRSVLNTVLPRAGVSTTDISKRKNRDHDTELMPSSRRHREPSRITASRPDLSTADIPAAGYIRPILRILSEEIDIPLASLKDDLLFADYGLDSLLALSITGRIREELEYAIESSVLLTCTSLGQLKSYLAEADKQGVMVSSGSSTGAADSSTLMTTPEEVSGDTDAEDSDVDLSSALARYRATSTLLQGSPKKAKHVLFLFPDGSGSATSYAAINEIGPDICIYGLNCPWLKTANALREFGIKNLASLYVDEIRRRRPQGPYSLGGWSAGGICAYEAAIRLTTEGERVNHLVLLDSPGPIGLEKLPRRLFDFLNARGVFGEHGQSAPDWLLDHFLAFIDALDDYQPVPWSRALDSFCIDNCAPPKTHILWAEDGVCKGDDEARPQRREDDPREMWWLLENRHDFGPNGWEVLLGDDVSIQRIADVNHFTMMRRGKATREVGEFLAQVLR